MSIKLICKSAYMKLATQRLFIDTRSKLIIHNYAKDAGHFHKYSRYLRLKFLLAISESYAFQLPRSKYVSVAQSLLEMICRSLGTTETI